MVFSEFVVLRGLITVDEAVGILDAQRAMRKPFGAVAIQIGKLSVKDVFSILNRQIDSPQKLFGEIAIDLGFMNSIDVRDVLKAQQDSCPSFERLVVDWGLLPQSVVDQAYETFIKGVTQDFTETTKEILPNIP